MSNKTQNLIITVVLVVLVIVSAVQALQLTQLKSEVQKGGLPSASSIKIGTSGAGVTASGLDDLPSMVGGC